MKKRGLIVITIFLIFILAISSAILYAKTTIIPSREISMAEHDLNSAKLSYANNDTKWATIQAYFSVYHSAQAIVGGVWEIDKANSHKSLSKAIASFEEKGDVPERFGERFNLARWARVKANYHGYYYDEDAMENIETAEDFLEYAKEINDVE